MTSVSHEKYRAIWEHTCTTKIEVVFGLLGKDPRNTIFNQFQRKVSYFLRVFIQQEQHVQRLRPNVYGKEKLNKCYYWIKMCNIQ